MDDFTKEELEDMKSWGELWCIGSKMSEMVNRPLLDKIQCMIDNYCEHKWENMCSQYPCCCHTLDDIHCNKCKKNMGDI